MDGLRTDELFAVICRNCFVHMCKAKSKSESNQSVVGRTT